MDKAMMMAAQHPQETQRVMAGAEKASKTYDSSVEKAGSSSTLKGAAAVGAVVGAVVSGPILALAGAAGMAYAAGTKDGAGGDVARSAGGAAAAAGRRASELNQKHEVTTKLKAGASAGFTKAKEVNEKHQIATKAKSLFSMALAKSKAANEKYDITGKAAKATTKVLDTATSKMAPKSQHGAAGAGGGAGAQS